MGNKMSIFISIASYEDPTLIRTIKSALKNADKPNELIFGLGLAYKTIPDLSFLSENQKKIIEFDVNSRPGVCRARYLIKKLYDQEDYFLQIDSHMIFDKSWDSYLINKIKEISINENQEKISISVTLDFENFKLNYYSKNKLYRDDNYNWFNFNGVQRFLAEKEGYFPEVFITAQMIFMDKKAANDIQWDQHSQFLEEEIYLSFLFFMNGYTNYRISGYFPIIHNNKDYNLSLYGDELVSIKHFEGTQNLTQPDPMDMMKALLLNKGLYGVDNPKREVKDFWLKLDLENDYNLFYDKMYKQVES